MPHDEVVAVMCVCNMKYLCVQIMPRDQSPARSPKGNQSIGSPASTHQADDSSPEGDCSGTSDNDSKRTIDSPVQESRRRRLRNQSQNASSEGENTPQGFKVSPRRPIHGSPEISPIAEQSKGSTSKQKSPKGGRSPSDSMRKHPSSGPPIQPAQLDLGPNDATVIAACALFVVIIIAGCKLYLNQMFAAPPTPPKLSVREQMSTSFDASFRQLMTDFPAQSKSTWKLLKATTSAVLRTEDPAYPGVTLVVANRSSIATADCIIGRLAHAISGIYGTGKEMEVLGEGLWGAERSPEEVKLLIDERLEAAFRQGRRVAWIQHAEQLHGTAALMFHSYCDNIYANERDAHFFFTVFMADQPLESFDETAVEQFLLQLWQPELELDKFYALWSRIGNNVVVLQPESDQVLNSKCR